MELIVLDTSLKMLSVLDTFESLIWTERYSAYGDFEVYTSINDSILEILKDDYYLWLKESDQTMIVEDRKIESVMMYGSHVFAPAGDGKIVPNRYTVGKTQLALFTVVPKFIANRATFWLRDVVSSANFALVYGDGNTNSSSASSSYGVRPVFPIG